MRAAVGVALLACLCACAAQRHGVIVRDPAQRIVSLIPSFTEDLCAIGAARQLVGVSQFSGDIACARDLPGVGNASSIDAERILRLHPDLVVGIPAQRALTAPLVRLQIPVVLIPDDTFGQLFGDIARLGQLSGHEGAASALLTALRARTRALQSRNLYANRPSVFVVLQAQPIWTAGRGSYISSLIRLAGARNAAAGLSAGYAQYSAEALLRAQPDAIVAGRDVHLQGVLGREPWRSLRAVREHRVYIYDSSLLDRPGPRYNQGLAWLIDSLRPLARAHARSSLRSTSRTPAVRSSPNS